MWPLPCHRIITDEGSLVGSGQCETEAKHRWAAPNLSVTRLNPHTM